MVYILQVRVEGVDVGEEGVGVLSVGEGSDPIVNEVSVGARRSGDGVLQVDEGHVVGRGVREGAERRRGREEEVERAPARSSGAG